MVFSDFFPGATDIIVSTKQEPDSVVVMAEVSVLTDLNNQMCPAEHSVNLKTNATNFYLSRDLTGKWEVKLKACLNSGYTEVIEISLADMTYGSMMLVAAPWTLKINIQTTQPSFLPLDYDNETVLDIGFCSSMGNLKVVSVRNAGSCISFNCSVQRVSTSELFWVVNGSTVMTDASTIHSNKVYKLNITCTESSNEFQATVPITTQLVSISFSTNCTTIEPSDIPQISVKNIATLSIENPVTDKVLKPTKHQRTDKKPTPGISLLPVIPVCECNKDTLYGGFFEEPGKVAVIALTGGVMIGFSIALGWFILARKCHLCFLFPIGVRPEERQTGRADQT